MIDLRSYMMFAHFLDALIGVFLLYVGKRTLDKKQIRRSFSYLLIIMGAFLFVIHICAFLNTSMMEGFKLDCWRDKTYLKHCNYIQDDEPHSRK